jgi:hypothetical protein
MVSPTRLVKELGISKDESAEDGGGEYVEMKRSPLGVR